MNKPCTLLKFCHNFVPCISASTVTASVATSEGKTVKDKGMFTNLHTKVHNGFTTPLWSISWTLPLNLCYLFLTDLYR